MERILGIDIGGVIIDRGADGSDTSLFGGDYLNAPAVPQAFETITQIRKDFNDVFLVSKCGHRIQQRTREWLAHNKFFEQTGVKADNLKFCKERIQKAPICKDNKITHFIDDRLEILGYLETVPHKYLFRPSDREVGKFKQHLNLVTQVSSWKDLLPFLQVD